MLHRFAFVVALWLTTWPVPGAPVAGNKSKKAVATDEKKKGAAMDTHTVKRGETIWGIARLHGVSVGDIMDLNHLRDSSLRDGQVLKIPSLGSDPALAPATPTTHVVAKGETFRSIARKYGLTQDDLERANPKADPAAPQAGSKLTIPATVSVSENTGPDADASKPPEALHTVTENDTYTSIAKKYGVTEGAISEANPDVNPNRLRPGSKLNIPQRAASPRTDDGDDAPAAASAALVTATATKTGAVPRSDADASKPAATLHTVTENDTYTRIAKKYGVTEGAIGEANPDVNPNRLRPGSKLNIPQRAASPRTDDGDGAPPSASARLVTATARKTGAVPGDAAGNAKSPANERTRSKTRRYVVSDDETPQTISEAFNITVSKLYEINGMKPGAPMKTGMEIQVPSSRGAAP